MSDAIDINELRKKMTSNIVQSTKETTYDYSKDPAVIAHNKRVLALIKKYKLFEQLKKLDGQL